MRTTRSAKNDDRGPGHYFIDGVVGRAGRSDLERIDDKFVPIINEQAGAKKVVTFTLGDKVRLFLLFLRSIPLIDRERKNKNAKNKNKNRMANTIVARPTSR